MNKVFAKNIDIIVIIYIFVELYSTNCCLSDEFVVVVTIDTGRSSVWAFYDVDCDLLLGACSVFDATRYHHLAPVVRML